MLTGLHCADLRLSKELHLKMVLEGRFAFLMVARSISSTSSFALTPPALVVRLRIMGDLRAHRLLLHQNSAESGGAIFSGGKHATTRLSFSTLYDNSAVRGGSIFNEGDFFSANNTVWNNQATLTATQFLNSKTASALMINTILGGDPTAETSGLSGSFTSAGNNIVVDPRSSTGFTNGENGDQVSIETVIDPLLGELSNNGGDSDSLLPLSESPAIRNGNPCIIVADCKIGDFPRLQTDIRRRFVNFSTIGLDVGAHNTNAILPSGSAFYGFISNGFQYGSLLKKTDLRDGAETVRIVSPFGIATFSDINATDVFLMEYKLKRRPWLDPSVIDRFNSISERFPLYESQLRNTTVNSLVDVRSRNGKSHPKNRK